MIDSDHTSSKLFEICLKLFTGGQRKNVPNDLISII